MESRDEPVVDCDPDWYKRCWEAYQKIRPKLVGKVQVFSSRVPDDVVGRILDEVLKKPRGYKGETPCKHCTHPAATHASGEQPFGRCLDGNKCWGGCGCPGFEPKL